VSRAELSWFRLGFPREGVTAEAVTSVLGGLSGADWRTRLVLELSATAAGIQHRIGVSPYAIDALTSELRAAIPSLHLDPIEPPATSPTRRLLWQLVPRAAVLRVDRLDAIAASLLAAAFPLRFGETVQLIWHLWPAVRPQLQATPQTRIQGQAAALRAKLSLPGWQAHGDLSVTAATDARARHLLSRTSSVLRSLSTPHGRLIGEPWLWGQMMRLLGQRGRFFSVKELAAVTAWPIGAPDLPGLTLSASKRLLPSAELPSTGRILGVTNFPGIEREVAVTPTASTRGTYILGPTGTGKTSLIKNSVRDEIEQGGGLCVIDTNGDLPVDLLDLIPEHRLDDVVWLDPTDSDYAVGFNPFAGSSDPYLVADQLSELFERSWKAFWGPRTAQLAHMGLLSLAVQPGGGASLLDLPRLYTDARFRAATIAKLDDPVGLAPDWNWLSGLPEKELAAIAAPLLNKCRAFTARQSIRHIIGQAQPKITMGQIMAEQKILLVNLPKGLLGAETVKLLGSLILVSLWQAATERARLPLSKRHPFGLIVDEVQDFAAAPVPWGEMFSQGRKYGLALTAAHQNLDQIPRELREVILANARSKVVFTLSPSDARVMERLFAPSLSAADLQALPAHTIAALVALDDGSTARPVTLTTPPPPKGCGVAEQVRQASRHNYARPRAEVEAELRRQVEAKPTGPVGSKRRHQ
jgi:hypothetical protein